MQSDCSLKASLSSLALAAAACLKEAHIFLFRASGISCKNQGFDIHLILQVAKEN